MSDDLCFFCEKNAVDHTYACCKKTCCKDCFYTYYKQNRMCPWCRQDPSTFKLTPQVKTDSFDEWLTVNNIERTSNINMGIKHMRTIEDCFARKQSPFVEFQVANYNKIHVFRYNNIKELSFHYWEQYDLIEITGGMYYRRGKLEPCDMFGWWLHGFIKQV
jgi:hypothetical protein